jgi:hypothetical protein
MLLRNTTSSAPISTIDFIRWLTQKTTQARIFWERRPHMVTATLRNCLLVQFVTSVTTAGEEAWRLFIICDADGLELYRVTDIHAANDPAPVAPAVDSLFLVAISLCHVH